MSAADNAREIAARGGDTREGLLFAVAAFALWGFMPLYMKAVDHIPPAEVVAHRILWSVPVAGAVLLALGRTADIGRAVRSPAMLAQAALTASLITVNWTIYVWAIAVGRTLETALGYYINPIFSVALGAIFLGERLSPLQLLAIFLAAAAVALLAVAAGGLPWVSLTLPVSFAFYALFKKTLPIGPNQGFFLEVLLLSPVALAYILWLAWTGTGDFLAGSAYDTLMLLLAGAVTAVPLILYGNGAKLLRLSTIGIMQYIAPTLIFLIAVLVFGEPFDLVRLAAFILIWAALVLYSWSMFAQSRAGGAGPPPA